MCMRSKPLGQATERLFSEGDFGNERYRDGRRLLLAQSVQPSVDDEPRRLDGRITGHAYALFSAVFHSSDSERGTDAILGTI